MDLQELVRWSDRIQQLTSGEREALDALLVEDFAGLLSIDGAITTRLDDLIRDAEHCLGYPESAEAVAEMLRLYRWHRGGRYEQGAWPLRALRALATADEIEFFNPRTGTVANPRSLPAIHDRLGAGAWYLLADGLAFQPSVCGHQRLTFRPATERAAAWVYSERDAVARGEEADNG